MERASSFATLAGRCGLALIFLLSGVGKLADWSGTAEQMAEAGMPAVNIFLAGAIAFEIGGALMLIVGFRARLGALLLIIFLIPASLIFHAFWAIEGDGQQIQMIMFLKNVSIGGGLLFVLGNGAGPSSMDHRAKRS